jgi:hypothetical protein
VNLVTAVHSVEDADGASGKHKEEGDGAAVVTADVELSAHNTKAASKKTQAVAV